jgi:cyanate permease
MVHCIPFLTDLSIDPVSAGGLMGMMVFFTIPSRFFGGIIADRFKKEQLKYLLSASFSLTAVGILNLFLSESMTSIYIFLILLGLGSGSFIPLDIVIRGRFFGRKAYGSIQGSTAVISVPVTFSSPIFTGWAYDLTGNYMTAFFIFCLIAVVSAIMILFIKSPKLP